MTKTKQRKLIVSLSVCIVFAISLLMLVFFTPIKSTAEDTSLTSETFAVEMAQVRQYDNTGGYLRFVVRVSKEVFTNEQFEGWEYGTLLLPADKLPENEELTIGTDNVLKIPTVNWQKNDGDDNCRTYTAVLKGKEGDAVIPDTYYNRPIIARGYVTNGSEIYYTEPISRSIGYVATMNVAVPEWEALESYDIASEMNGNTKDAALTDTESNLGITSVKEYTILSWQNASFADHELLAYNEVKFYMQGAGSIKTNSDGGDPGTITYLSNDAWKKIHLIKNSQGTGFDVYVDGALSSVKFYTDSSKTTEVPLTNMNQFTINGTSGTVKYSNVIVTKSVSESLISIANGTNKKVSFDKTELVSTTDTLIPNVEFGGITVSEEYIPRLNISYEAEGNGISVDSDSKVISTNGLGTSAVTATLNIPGFESIISSETNISSHSLVHHGAVAATCEGTGSKEYWSCSGCENIYYADENALSKHDTIDITPLGHKYAEIDRVEPTYVAVGAIYSSCTYCYGEIEEPITAVGYKTTEGTVTLSAGGNFKIVALSELGGATEYTNPSGYTDSGASWAGEVDYIFSNVQKGTIDGAATATNFFRITLNIDFTQYTSTSFEFGMNYSGVKFIIGGKTVTTSNKNTWNKFTVMSDGSVYFNGEQISGAKMTGNSIVLEMDKGSNAPYAQFVIKQAVNTFKETREYDLALGEVTGTPITDIGGTALTPWASAPASAEKTVSGVKQNVISQQIQNYKNESSSKVEWNYFRYTLEVNWKQFGSITIPVATNVITGGAFDIYVDGVKGVISEGNAWSYITVKQDGSVYFNGTLMEGALVDDLIVIEMDTHRPTGTYYGEFYIGTPTFTLPVPEGPKWEDIDIDLAAGMSGTKTDITPTDAEKELGITSIKQYTFNGFQNSAFTSLDLTKYETVKFYLYRPTTNGGGSIKDATDGGYTILYLDGYKDQWVEIEIKPAESGTGYDLYANGTKATALKNDAVLTNLNQLTLNGSSGTIKYSNVVGIKLPEPEWKPVENYDIASGMGGTKADGTVDDAAKELGITSVKEYTFTAWQNAAFASLDLTKYEMVKFYMYRPSSGGGGSIYDASSGSYSLFYLNPNDSWVEILIKQSESGTGYDIYVNGTKNATALANSAVLKDLNQLALNGASGKVKYSNVFGVELPGPKWEAIDTDIASGMSGTKTSVTPTVAEKDLGITSVTEYTFGGFQNAAFASLDLTQYQMIRFYMYYPSTGGGGSIKDATDGGYTVLYLDKVKDAWTEIIIKPAESGEGYELYANGTKATALKNGAALTNLNQLALNGSSGKVKYSNIMVVNFPEPLYKDLGVDIGSGMSGTKTTVIPTVAEKELGIMSIKEYTFGGFQNTAFASLDLTKYESVKFYMYYPTDGGAGSIKDATDGGHTVLYLSNYKDQWVEIEIKPAESGEGYELYANGTKATALKNGVALTNLNQLALNGSSGKVKYSNVVGHIAGEYVQPEEEEVIEYSIVYETGSAEIAYASQELQKYFKEATGTRLFKSAYKNADSANGYVIVLGVQPALDKDFDLDSLGESDYVIKKDGKVIYIYGKTGYGVINGVYALLGQLFEFELFYEDTYKITARKNFTLTPDEVTEVQSDLTFDYIWSGLGELKPTEENSYSQDYAYQMGFVTDYYIGYNNVHNATTLLEEYRASHPEWFYSESGKNYGQIYLSAENFATGEGTLVTTVAQKIFDMLKADTTYEREIALLFSAMDEDIWPHGTGYANSDALFNKYGTYAAENIIFMNAVAKVLDAMMTADPLGRTIQLELLCYNKTLVAPELSGLSDADKAAIMLYQGTNISVVPMIAPVEGNRYLAFTDSRNKVKNPATGEIDSGSKTIAEVIEGWQALVDGGDMHMWWYASDGFDFFVMMDTITNMQANYQFAAEHGITIMYNQSQGNNAVAPDWSRLKIYVQSQLQKDVNCDIDAIIDKWMDAYFGAGAESMKTLLSAQKTWYVNFFGAVFKENEGHYTAGGFAYSDDMAKWHFTESPKKPTFSFLDSTKNTMLVTWMGYIDSAKAAINADTSLTDEQKAELCNRVDLESLTIRYTLIEVFGTKTYDQSTSEFYQFAKSLGVTRSAEGTLIP